MEKRYEGLIESVKNLCKKHQEVIMYLVFGVLTTVVSLIAKYALLFTICDAKKPLELETAVVISWVCAVTFAFVTNRKYVFKSKVEGKKGIVTEGIKFFGARLSTLGLEAVLMWLFINVLERNSDKEVAFWTLVVQGMVIIANYFLSKFLVFTKPKKEAV